MAEKKTAAASEKKMAAKTNTAAPVTVADVPEEKKERKPLVVNDRVLETHRANHTFRSAAPGKSHDSPITGASSRWMKTDGDTIIYDAVFRTVGTEDQIRAELTRSGVSAGEIDDALDRAYTLESATQDGPIRDQYLSEVEGAKMTAYTTRNFGMEWQDVAPFFQAKKSEISRKGKGAKAKRRGDAKNSKPRKRKTASETRKEFIEGNSDYVVVYNMPKGWVRMKETSIGRNYFFNRDHRIALQTPDDLAAAMAENDFGKFDISAEFDRWYRGKQSSRKPAESGASTTTAPSSTVATTATVSAPAPSPASTGQQSPVKARAAPAARAGRIIRNPATQPQAQPQVQPQVQPQAAVRRAAGRQ